MASFGGVRFTNQQALNTINAYGTPDRGFNPLGAIGGAVTGFATGGIGGAVIGAATGGGLISGARSGPAGPMINNIPVNYINPGSFAPTNGGQTTTTLPGGAQQCSTVEISPFGIPIYKSVSCPTPGSFGPALPQAGGQGTALVPAQSQAVCRTNKSGYYKQTRFRDPTSAVYIPPKSVCVKRRKTNPLNPRAASRAIKRIEAAQKAVKRIMKVRTHITQSKRKKGCRCK